MGWQVSELIPSVTQIRYALLAEENEGKVLHSPSSGSQVGCFILGSLILPDFAQGKQTAIYQRIILMMQ